MIMKVTVFSNKTIVLIIYKNERKIIDSTRNKLN